MFYMKGFSTSYKNPLLGLIKQSYALLQKPAPLRSKWIFAVIPLPLDYPYMNTEISIGVLPHRYGRDQSPLPASSDDTWLHHSR